MGYWLEPPLEIRKKLHLDFLTFEGFRVHGFRYMSSWPRALARPGTWHLSDGPRDFPVKPEPERRFPYLDLI